MRISRGLRASIALTLALVPNVLTTAADGPPPPGTTTQGISAPSSAGPIFPIVDLPSVFPPTMTLPSSAGDPTAPVWPMTDAISQLIPSPDPCVPQVTFPPLGLTPCTLSTSPAAPQVTLTTSATRTQYATGEAVGFKLTVANPSKQKMVVSSVSNPIPTGFMAMPAEAITMDGTLCDASTSPACTLTSQGMQVSSFSLNNGGQHVFAYAMVVDWSTRGCGQLLDQAHATSSGGTGTGSAPIIVCDGGLGSEPWWSFVSQSTGPQGTVAMNANSGNLVATQDDSTAIPGHGRLVLQPHRVYNSQDSGLAPTPNSFGSGWVIDFEHWTGSPLGIGALYVPPAESVASNHPVTLIDDGGSRQVVVLRSVPSPIDVTAMQQRADSTPWSVLTPRVLQLDASRYDHICVDETATPTPGVHLGMWRYTEVKAAASNATCTPAAGTTPVVLGWGIETPDRLRYEFAWNGAKLDAEDGNANEVRYTYAAAPAASAALGNLTRVAEVSSGRAFALTVVSATETDISDPASRTTRYLYDGSGHLTSVANPDGHGVSYVYGGCTGAGTLQLCSISDPRGHHTSFTYTATWSDGTAVLGAPKLASLTDRLGATMNLTHVHAPDSVTADLGIERTRYMSFDGGGSVGEIDGIDISNTSSPVTLHKTLDFWDTASGAPSCAQPDGGIDHDLCRTFQATMNGLSTAEDTTYTYNMVGQPLIERQCIGSGDSSSPPACPASSSASPSSRDTTWGYHALYVEATGSAAAYDDTVPGGGSVTSPSVTGGARWDAQTLYALYDNTGTLDGRGNTPGLSSSQVQGFLHTIVVDDVASLAPNRAIAAGTCPTVAANTGNVCSTSTPALPAPSTFSYAYDQYGQRVSVSTPDVLAASAQPFIYTYYPDSALDLSGTTSAGGWLRGVTDPYGHFVAYAYDAAGGLTRTWDADATSGLQLSAFPGTVNAPPSTAYSETLRGSGASAYSTPWRYVVSVRDQLGDVTSYTLDANGNQLTIRPPRGNAANSTAYDITQTFDNRDQLLTKLTPVEVATGSSWHYGYDAAGNHTSVTDPRGVVTVDVYDAVNRLVKTKYTLASSGYETTPTACTTSQASDAPIPANRIMCTRAQSYDGVDNVTAFSDGNGQVTTITYDGVHDEVSRATPRNDGTYTTLRTDHLYDLDGNVTTVCSPRAFTDGSATSCGTNGIQTYAVYLSYDGLDRLASHTTYILSPGGGKALWTAQTSSFQYDGDGNLTLVTDPNNHQRSATFDLLDRRSALSVQRDASTSIQTADAYDPAGRLLSETVGSHATAYAYDSAGQLTDEVRGWDGSSAVASAVASSDGGTNIHSHMVYDADGNLVQTYDPRAFSGSSADQRSFMTTAVYDADGRPSAVYRPRYDGGAYSDLSSSSATQSTQCPGNRSGYPATVGVCVETASYDGVGELAEVILPTATGGSAARKIDYTHTDDGHLLMITEPSPSGSGTVTRQFGYDAEGRTVKSLDELSRATTVSFTSDGLPSMVTAEPNGSISHITRYTYNADGEPSTVVNAAGLTTTYSYDSDDRTLSVADNAGNTTRYAYDKAGNALQVFSPSASAKTAPNTSGTPTTNTYTYDNLLLSSTRPVSSDGTSQLRRTTYSYADFGAKASQDTALVNSSGTVLGDAGTQTFAWYPDERLHTETGRHGETISRVYDATGNQASVTFGSSTVSASYYLDGLTRSVTDSAPVGGSGNATMNYAYDGLGNMASQLETLSSGGQYATTYAYGDAELPVAMNTSWLGNWSWSYDNAGQVAQENDPNSDYAVYVWNADGTLNNRQYLTAGGGTMSIWEYLYDSGYRQTERDYHGATANNHAVDLYTTYGYDNAGRLSRWHRSDLIGNQTVTDKSATWDADGNRLTWGDGTPANSVTNTYNADDSVATTVTNNGTTYGVSYNNAGDTASDGCRSYSYDGFDQLTNVSPTGGSNCGRVESAWYAYDGLGRRTVVSDGPYGAATAVHFRGLTSAVATEQQVTGHSADVVYALSARGSVLADSFAPQTFNLPEYLSQDGFSSITNATASTGAMACDAFADPFGTPFGGAGTNVCHTGSMNDTLLYQQAQRDPTSGVYQMGARVYDPNKAGFVQPDSYRVGGSDLGVQSNPLTANLYGYVDGDPVNFADPTGHNPCSEEGYDDSGAQGCTPAENTTLAAGSSPGAVNNPPYSSSSGHGPTSYGTPAPGANTAPPLAAPPRLGPTPMASGFNFAGECGPGCVDMLSMPLGDATDAALGFSTPGPDTCGICEFASHFGGEIVSLVKDAAAVAAGVATGLACEAATGVATGGLSTGACVVAGFAAGGAVAGALNCSSGNTLTCAGTGALAGAAGGVAFVATGGVGAGIVATAIAGGAAGAASSAASQALTTGHVDIGQVLTSAAIGAAAGGVASGISNAVGGTTGGSSTAGLPDAQNQLASSLRVFAQQQAGFAGDGEPLIIDNSLPISPARVATDLRARGYNARSVGEIFGRDPGDRAIKDLADVIDGRVIASDVGHDIAGGFGERWLKIPGQVRTMDSVIRLLEAS